MHRWHEGGVREAGRLARGVQSVCVTLPDAGSRDQLHNKTLTSEQASSAVPVHLRQRRVTIRAGPLSYSQSLLCDLTSVDLFAVLLVAWCRAPEEQSRLNRASRY